MIKNDKQYSITKSKRDEFKASLESLSASENNYLLHEIMISSIKSQIDTFEKEIAEYEKLKIEKPKILSLSIENLPDSLIQARIVKGLSHSDLARMVGLKEQQIQRYESNGYASANFERILSVAKSMDVNFEDTKLIINQDPIAVEGYEPCFIKQATHKLQSRKSLLTV
jgi:HTH-type transcriptional regulator/antitoxin HipB